MNYIKCDLKAWEFNFTAHDTELISFQNIQQVWNQVTYFLSFNAHSCMGIVEKHDQHCKKIFFNAIKASLKSGHISVCKNLEINIVQRKVSPNVENQQWNLLIYSWSKWRYFWKYIRKQKIPWKHSLNTQFWRGRDATAHYPQNLRFELG